MACVEIFLPCLAHLLILYLLFTSATTSLQAFVCVVTSNLSRITKFEKITKWRKTISIDSLRRDSNAVLVKLWNNCLQISDVQSVHFSWHTYKSCARVGHPSNPPHRIHPSQPHISTHTSIDIKLSCNNVRTVLVYDWAVVVLWAYLSRGCYWN